MGNTVMTGCDVKRPGIYRCITCDNQLRMDSGEEAPGCKHCHDAPVTWVFVRPLVGRIGFTS